MLIPTVGRWDGWKKKIHAIELTSVMEVGATICLFHIVPTAVLTCLPTEAAVVAFS